MLATYRDIAKQYSPNNIVFTVSLVDGGTVELLRGLGKNVVSSADLVALFEATWSEEQIKSHFAARDSIDTITAAAFQEIGRRARNGGTKEHEIQQWFMEAFQREGLLTDDPPKSSGSLARAAHEIERLGFDERSIVLLLPLLGDMEVPPPSLRRYPSIVLPWEDWSVHARLEASAVFDALAEMVGSDSEVGSVHPLAMPTAKRRGHVRPLYRVQLRRDGEQLTRDICVEGVGIGYFGDHALAVARRLGAFLPKVIGVRDGLVYREWLPERGRVDPPPPERVGQIAAGMVDYVTSRARALAVDEDTSLRLIDRGAVWQRAGDIIMRAFGPASQASRLCGRPGIAAASRELVALRYPLRPRAPGLPPLRRRCRTAALDPWPSSSARSPPVPRESPAAARRVRSVPS